MRVAVIDDEPMLARMLVLAITLGGHHADHVPGDTYRSIDWSGFDAVVCDLMMPGLSGADVLAWLQTHQPHVRRVLLTASATITPELADLADEALLKPQDIGDLLAALERVR